MVRTPHYQVYKIFQEKKVTWEDIIRAFNELDEERHDCALVQICESSFIVLKGGMLIGHEIDKVKISCDNSHFFEVVSYNGRHPVAVVNMLLQMGLRSAWTCLSLGGCIRHEELDQETLGKYTNEKGVSIGVGCAPFDQVPLTGLRIALDIRGGYQAFLESVLDQSNKVEEISYYFSRGTNHEDIHNILQSPKMERVPKFELAMGSELAKHKKRGICWQESRLTLSL